MKFYLVKNEQLNLHMSDVIRGEQGVVRRQVLTANVIPSGDSEEEKQFCERLQSKLREIYQKDDCRKSLDRKQLILSMALVGDSKGVVGIADGFGNILENLSKILGDDTIKLEVMISNFRKLNVPPPEKRFNIFTKELNVYHRDIFGCFVSDEAEFHFDTLKNQFRNEDSQLGGSISIGVIVDQSSLKCDNCADKFEVFKKMLEEEVCTDAVIIAKDGVQVKCHKGMLGAQSSVLKTMMQQTKMKEANTGIVEMLDMGEDSVRAFLAYLYHWDDTAARNDSQVAFDLFHAGHKYDVPSLEKTMEKVFLSKPSQWFDVEVALKLFLFARNLASNSLSKDKGPRQLKLKAFKVLKL